MTPLRAWTGVHALARLRRMLGLFTFFYALLHFLWYAWLDMGFYPGDIVCDIPKRPFILVGVSALLLMLPLAATSFNRAIKALGAKRWQALHRAVYAIALLALLHFFWSAPARTTSPNGRSMPRSSACCLAGACSPGGAAAAARSACPAASPPELA